ncbi:S1C family serine protease [Streptomyces jumonjinensis]|uniref:Trypsin-like serine protease n=1 Tax=Streptomyces jumonjinensis TaxID=1945 RepID=A0A646KRK5_STRJU|nr:trypsin-like peptidase domain-containing protein [Streptomyces jumonjinensis]MQT04883.1 trypsin-like serine protease [Streptomyces jumonjinensis]
MTDLHHDEQPQPEPYHPQAYDSAYPPPPAQPPHPHRARARRPVALLVAVAIAAAAVGGGTSVLLDRVTGEPGGGGGNGISGTNVSASSSGTVAGVAQALMPSTVEIQADNASGQSTGSGVIITSDGEVITNNHVVAGADTVKVRLNDGSTHTADVIGTDPDLDLALVKLQGVRGLQAATLGDSSTLKVGEEVVAIGSPGGLTGTVTSGIVSAVDRDVTVAKEPGRGQPPSGGWPFEFGGREFNGDTGDSRTTYKAIQTDASLNPGNSGGALINMRGEIIGINSAMYSPSTSTSGDSGTGSVGLGFAIPVDTVKSVLGDLRDGDG